jgi:hypothetical protein
MKMLSYIPEKLEMRTIAAKHGGAERSPRIRFSNHQYST